jgi:beta-galactosidase
MEAINFYSSDMVIAFKDQLLSQQKTYPQTLPLDWYRIPEWQKLSNEYRDSLKKEYQPVELWVKESSGNTLYLTNQHDFINLDNIYLQWQIMEGGKVVEQGQINELPVLPGKTMEINLPFKFSNYKSGQSCQFIFSLHLKESTLWAEKNHEIAREEFTFTATDKKGVLTKSKPQK